MADQRSGKPKRVVDPGQQKAAAEDVDLSRPVELVSLAVKDAAVRCRLPGTRKDITLRAPRYWKALPGTMVTVRPRKMWLCAGHPYLSGEILATRIDAAAIGLEPLGLKRRDIWDPARACWLDEDRPVPEYARAIIACGSRRIYEMEQVLPGGDPDDPWSDPIIESADRMGMGDSPGALDALAEPAGQSGSQVCHR